MQKLFSVLITFVLIVTMAVPVFSQEVIVSESTDMQTSVEPTETPLATDAKEIPDAGKTTIEADAVLVPHLATAIPIETNPPKGDGTTATRTGNRTDADPFACGTSGCDGIIVTPAGPHTPVSGQTLFARCANGGESTVVLFIAGPTVIDVDQVLRYNCATPQPPGTTQGTSSDGSNNSSRNSDDEIDTPVENTPDVDESVEPTGDTELVGIPTAAFSDSPPLDVMVIGKADGRNQYQEPVAQTQPAPAANPIAGLVSGSNAPILGLLALLIVGAFFVFRKK